MKRASRTVLSLLAVLSLAAGRPGGQPEPQPDEQHPEVGHPAVPRPVADWPEAKPEDVGSIDAIVSALYGLTSGAAGQPRDWDRFRSIFLPEARLVAARPAADGSAGAFFLKATEYVDANRKYFEKGGFFEKEVARRVERFGNIAHVWSTYESRHTPDAPEPYIRGINSIQLLKDGDRWWIVNVYWDFERDTDPIPAKYLQTSPD